MTAISTNYADRTVDLLTHQDIQVGKEVQVQLSLGDAASVCTGIQKVAQQFTIMFLTDIGSKPRDENFGTSFLTALNAGSIQDDEEVTSFFQLAMSEIRTYLDENDIEGETDDETFDSAELTGWDLRPGFLSLNVRVTSLAGDERDIILPVKVAIR